MHRDPEHLLQAHLDGRNLAFIVDRDLPAQRRLEAARHQPVHLGQPVPADQALQGRDQIDPPDLGLRLDPRQMRQKPVLGGGKKLGILHPRPALAARKLCPGPQPPRRRGPGQTQQPHPLQCGPCHHVGRRVPMPVVQHKGPQPLLPTRDDAALAP